MNPESKYGLPWGWRLTRLGMTRAIEGKKVIVEFSNPGIEQAVEFRGKLYRRLEDGKLELYSDEQLAKLKR